MRARTRSAGRSASPNLGSNEQFASGLAAISSVIIAGDLLGGIFVALDDLAFETSDISMPEPGMLALIGSGLAAPRTGGNPGVAVFRSRQANQPSLSQGR